MEKALVYKKSNGKVLGGSIIIGVGLLLLVQKFGVVFPYWLFSWKTALIAIGLILGAKHRFRYFGWMLFVMAGVLFLLEDIIPGINMSKFIWPIIIVVAGIFTIFFNPFNVGGWKNPWTRKPRSNQEITSEEDFIESMSLFGGIRKNVLSKKFKGGEIATVVGGTEINLSKADINGYGKAVLEVAAVLGGVKIIVPPDWDVKSEVIAILGTVEDKRPLQTKTNSDKVLIIRGAAVLGGIDIRS